jgi:hypothetical protein
MVVQNAFRTIGMALATLSSKPSRASRILMFVAHSFSSAIQR